MTDLIVAAEASPDDLVGLMRAMVVGSVVQKDKELQATNVINADQKAQLEAKDAALLLKDAQAEDKDKAIDDLSEALAAEKEESQKKHEALAAAEQEGKNWETKFKTIKGKLEDYVKGEEGERERMEQRHAGELQRNVDQAVATAVEEKDKEIRSLERKIKLLKRASIELPGSTASV